jgi:internalin A
MKAGHAWAALVLSLAIPTSISADDWDVVAGLEKLGARISRGQTGRVTGVQLHGENVTDAALAPFKLDDFKSLTSLSVARTSVTDKWLADFLPTANERDGHSEFGSTNRAASAKASDPSFAARNDLKNFETLDLSHTKITGKGLGHLKVLKGLKSLDLSANPAITDDSMREVNALTNLRSVNLNGTGVTIKGLTMLTNLKNISSWNFFGRDLTDGELAALRLGGQFDSCEILNCGLTKVTDRGMPSLNGLAKLKTLVLTRTKVSDDGMKKLTQLPALTSLFVDFTQVTSEGEKLIRMNLPNCRAFVR